MGNKRRRRIVTLTTDYGLDDHYAGLLKGVILSINSEVLVADICHTVPAQDIAAGAFLLGSAWRFFPADTIHVVVVDPGVGSQRAAIAIRTPGGTFLGPDNGVLSAAIRDQSRELPESGGPLPVTALGRQFRAVRLSNPAFWLPRVSVTFHGRDIFAPVAAHLSAGVPIDELGELAETVLLLPAARAVGRPDGSLLAHVVYIDHFGNLVTDLTADQASTLAGPLSFEIGGRVCRGLHRYFAEGPELLALVGSSDRVEIAMRNGSAAVLLGVRVGDAVIVRPVSGE